MLYEKRFPNNGVRRVVCISLAGLMVWNLQNWVKIDKKTLILRICVPFYSKHGVLDIDLLTLSLFTVPARQGVELNWPLEHQYLNHDILPGIKFGNNNNINVNYSLSLILLFSEHYALGG